MSIAATKPKRNANASRTRILDAATAEFAAHGFEGARVDAIARRAVVNKNLLYHYFGNKEDLFVAVMEAIYRLMRAHHNELEIKDMAPAAAMAELVCATFRLFVERPEVISLLNTENLHRARHIRRSETIRDLYDPLQAALAEILAKGEARGDFRKGVDPVELYISISALGYFYVSNAHTLGFIFHRDLLAPERTRMREAHIVEMVLGYLRTGALPPQGA